MQLVIIYLNIIIWQNFKYCFNKSMNEETRKGSRRRNGEHSTNNIIEATEASL